MIGPDMNNRLLRTTAVAAAPVAAILLTAAPSVPASASSVQPVPAVVQAAQLTCSASMTNRQPADYTSTGVKVSTVAFAHIKTVAHYRTVTHPKYGTADSAGQRTIWYYISGATPGYRVVVDVYVSQNGRNGSCSTSFTPH
jgi:hypothetical protein